MQQKSDKFVSITSGRGRGKSALLGLLCAAAIGLGVGRVYVTAPSPENLNPVFKFLISGLEAMKYQQHIDFEIIQRVEKSNQNGANGSPASSNAALRVNVFKDRVMESNLFNMWNLKTIGCYNQAKSMCC